MKRRNPITMKPLLTALILASVTALHAAELQATFCNPLPIPNYPIGYSARNVENKQTDASGAWIFGHQEQFRELGDPTALWHEGKWYLYPSSSPLGPFEKIGDFLAIRKEIAQVPTVRDKMLFSDDDGRLYLYFGCSEAGVLLDSDWRKTRRRNLYKGISKNLLLI